MSAIRVIKHLDSDTLHLPELKPLIGRDVVITIRERGDALAEASEEFWNPPTLEELAAKQGVVGPANYDDLLGEGFEDAFDGFEAALDQWRSSPWAEAKGAGDGGRHTKPEEG